MLSILRLDRKAIIGFGNDQPHPLPGAGPAVIFVELLAQAMDVDPDRGVLVDAFSRPTEHFVGNLPFLGGPPFEGRGQKEAEQPFKRVRASQCLGGKNRLGLFAHERLVVGRLCRRWFLHPVYRLAEPGAGLDP